VRTCAYVCVCVCVCACTCVCAHVCACACAFRSSSLAVFPLTSLPNTHTAKRLMAHLWQAQTSDGFDDVYEHVMLQTTRSWMLMTCKFLNNYVCSMCKWHPLAYTISCSHTTKATVRIEEDLDANLRPFSEPYMT